MRQTLGEEFNGYFEPAGFFQSLIWGSYLTKFRGTLTAEAMKEDAVFTPAENDEPFRETIRRW